jgi:hypothetical protein
MGHGLHAPHSVWDAHVCAPRFGNQLSQLIILHENSANCNDKKKLEFLVNDWYKKLKIS